MKENPLLTIFVLTHNSERFLRETLKSVLDQDYPDFKVIVSDNASTDRTEEIVKSFRDPKLSFRKNTTSTDANKDVMKCGDNYNGCIKSGLAKGEFIAFYHHDDIYEKDIARKEVEFLLAHPEAGAVFTLGTLIDENDKMIGKFQLPKELRKKELYNFMDIFKVFLKSEECPIVCPTFMARKKIFKKIGLFRKDFGSAADVEWWLRILKNYPIGILEENLIKYRRSNTQGSQTYQYLRIKRAHFFLVMDYYLTSLKGQIENKLLRQYEYNKNYDDVIRARNLLMKNKIKEAKNLLNKSFSLNIWRAFFEDMSAKKIKGMVFRIILLVGANIGLGKYLGWLLYKRILSK